MTLNNEADVLASFNRHLAGIEAEVKDGSASAMPRRAVVSRPTTWRPRATGRGVVLPLLVVIALAVVIAVIRPLAVPPGPGTGPVRSQPTSGASSTPSAGPGQGPARLRIQAEEQRIAQPDPSGIYAPGGVVPPLLFRLAITSPAEATTVTIPADATWQELDLTPGSYGLAVSERIQVLDLDNGRNVVLAGSGPCVLQLGLAAGTTTLLTVTDVVGQACTFSQRSIVPPSSPSPAPSTVSMAPTLGRLMTKTRAIDDAELEVPTGASYESISDGTFGQVQLPPPWLRLDQLVPAARDVWIARFTDPSTCPGRKPCGETVVFLDYVSGDFLVSVHLPAAP